MAWAHPSDTLPSEDHSSNKAAAPNPSRVYQVGFKRWDIWAYGDIPIQTTTQNMFSLIKILKLLILCYGRLCNRDIIFSYKTRVRSGRRGNNTAGAGSLLPWDSVVTSACACAWNSSRSSVLVREGSSSWWGRSFYMGVVDFDSSPHSCAVSTLTLSHLLRPADMFLNN